ncbi:hypothetical protein V5O48_000298 [Marasmius crinis-equi]|uniref:FAD-binding FR-type domain-containing protein n=1 Tax=Marasmius crinis-equi TaxID=585013 RepID=A0ABR3G216_9AGAR
MSSPTTALSAQPTVPNYPDDLQWVTAYLVAHMMSDNSRRYVYALWFCIASVFVVYTVLHWTGSRGGAFGCYWRKWAIRRRTWRVGSSFFRNQPKRGFRIAWPSNGQLLCLAALPITTILLSFAGPDYISPKVNVFDITPQDISARSIDITPFIQYQPQYQIRKAWWTAGGRTGLIAFGLMPLVVLFALKAPPFAVLALPITNLHFDKLSWLHRWSARLLYFITLSHVALWSVQLAVDYRKGQPGYSYAWQYEKFLFGWTAFGAMTLLIFSSSRFLRHSHYETFYGLHVLLVPITIVFSALHHPPVAHWCWVALAIWVGERSWRATWWLQMNGFFGKEKSAPVIMPATPATPAPGAPEAGKYPPQSPYIDSQFYLLSDGNLLGPSTALEYTPPAGYAHAELLSGATVRLTYITPGFLSWAPGQHFLINVPSVSRFLTHPFTTASICDHQAAPSGRAIVFLVRCKNGWTRDLWDHVVKLQNQGENHVPGEKLPNGTVMPQRGVLLKMFVEGPFGSSAGARWGKYSTVMIFAAGSGVSFALSTLQFVCLCLAGRDGRKLGGHAGSWGSKGYKTQRIRFVWLIREYAHIQWCASILRRCLSMIPSPGLEVEIFVTNSKPEIARMSKMFRASKVVTHEPSRNKEVDEEDDEDVDLSYYIESPNAGDLGEFGDMSIEDYMRDLTDWDNELDDKLAGESRFSTMIRKEGTMLRRMSRAPASMHQKHTSFLITDPTWMPPSPGSSPLKHTSFLSADPTSIAPPSRSTLRQTLASVNESSISVKSVSSPLKSSFNAPERPSMEPPQRPSLDSFRRDSSELEAPDHPAAEAPPRPSWDSSWQDHLRKPPAPSAMSNEPPIRSSWDNTWQHLWKTPGPSGLSKAATSSPLKRERSLENLVTREVEQDEPPVDGRRLSIDSSESDLGGRPVSLYSLSDPIPRPLSPRVSHADSLPSPIVVPITPTSSVPMLQNQPYTPAALSPLQTPDANTDQEKHVAFQVASPRTVTPIDANAPRLNIDTQEMRDISMVSMNARPGKPSLQRILHEEVENAKGSVVVACCGPASFNAMVRKAVATEIDPTKAKEGEKPTKDPSPSPKPSLYNDIPSFLVSESPTTPSSEKPPVSPLAKTFKGSISGSQKEGSRKNETRKLLGHVLSQLSHRTMPPTVYDALGFSGDGRDGKNTGIVEAVKGAVKVGGGGNHKSTDSLGIQNTAMDEEDESGVFSTDETFELMVQLRDVLMIFLRQGWKVFEDGPEAISEIALALIPAFATFPYEFCGRLLAFFEECVVRSVLGELRSVQGLDDNPLDHGTPAGVDGVVPSAISIQVDAAPDEGGSKTGSDWAWSTVTSTLLALKSTNAPMQRAASYHLSSIIRPLLSTVLERFELDIESNSRADVTYRLSRLLTVVVELKFDAYLDILEVLAYHTSRAKRLAACLLATFWPRAVGHATISRAPLLHSSYTTSSYWSPLSSHSHQFVPWRFGCSTTSTPTSAQQQTCNVCSNDIEGFGLFCSLCVCSVHLGCYNLPSGSLVVDHSMNPNDKMKRVAIHRFSSMPGRINFNGHRHRHRLRAVNIFTLSICNVCREPLWGCYTQALHCTVCQQLVHSSCMTNPSFASCIAPTGSAFLESTIIAWGVLRQTCMNFYSDVLSFDRDYLRSKTYEDISTIYGTLWTQIELLENGITHGTLLVDGSTPQSNGRHIRDFELHRVLSWCSEILSAGAQAPSPGTMDFLQYNNVLHKDYSLLFDWSYLVFISAAIKMPLDIPPNGSDGFLSISPSLVDSGNTDHRGDEPSHPFEIAPLSHLRDALGFEFHFRCDTAARFMLSHLHHMGFIERFDSGVSLFEDGNRHVHCTFPLPLGLDVSSDVETLFAAVEACLSDLDLFVNEIGWLLLSRRLWPSGSASEYALGRLTRSILSWILAEDEDLATILRDYLAKQRPLPGVRSAKDPAPWPPTQSARQAPSNSINNGGDYVASRRALVNRYAVPWLAALHDQSPDNYAMILYDICNEVVDNTSTSESSWDVLHDAEDSRDPENYERVLRLMVRLSQNSIMFSASEAIFTRWLYLASSVEGLLLSSSSLNRILQSVSDASQRYSVLDGGATLSDVVSFDPWDLVTSTAAKSSEGLQTVLRWLRMFALSGVTIPYTIFEKIASFLGDSHEATSQFTHVLLLTAWQRPTNREQTQKLITNLHSRMHLSLMDKLRVDGHHSRSIQVIRQSLATCLLIYGCDRQKIFGSGLVLEDEIKALPSRRTAPHQVSAIVDPIVIDPTLMNVLETYLSANNDNITCIIAKFLNLFLMSSPYLEAHEVDNFILRNGRMLCNSAFQFYGIQRQELFTIRFGLLLRIVIVDTQPFREILEASFRQDVDWEIRLSAVTKIFRLILDITSPAQTVEGRQWRSSITDGFYHFFGTLWSDEKQEIRVAVETLCSTLLPSHFDEISLCWTELLGTSPIAERVKLATFLIQLRHHFPAWRVVSWNVISEILAEDQYEQEGGNKRDGALTSHLSMYGLASDDDEDGSDFPVEEPDSEMTSLRVSTLLLGLDMATNGIFVDYHDLLKMKIHVARMLGFDDVHAVPTQDGLTFYVNFGRLTSVPRCAFPCINQLLSLLDSPHPASLATLEGPARGDNRNPTPLLVGSLFIDLLLALFSSVKDVIALPILSVKSLLESLGVIIYKHDFEHMYIRPLQPALKQAVTLTMELMLEDVNYECRQLALHVTQAYIRKFHGTMRSLIHYSIEQVAKLVISQSHTSQDPFMDQAKGFLENTLKTYSGNGIFVGLIRRKLDRTIFTVLKQVLDANAKENRGAESLREALLRDTLPRAVESDQTVFQAVLNNLEAYIEVVHHQNYSKELMMFVGQHLTLLARRTSEWTPETVDPAPLLNIAAVLMQHNKAQSREMLMYTDTVLRATLTRLTVDAATVSRLVQVTSALYRRSEQESTNVIILALFELLNDGLRMKTRAPSGTIGALSETVMTAQVAGVPLMMTYRNLFHALGGPGLQFLYNFPWTWGDARSDRDFAVSLTVARLVLTVASRDTGVMIKMAEQGTEKCGKQSMSVRGWSVLVLAALMEGSDVWLDLMLSQLGPLSVAHHAALRSYSQPAGAMTESAIADINHAYIAIKLWLILAQKKSAEVGTGNDIALKVWDTLWPPFETLVNVFEMEVQAGLPMTLALLTWSTVADLFVFLRNLRSPVALHTSSQIATLERLKSLGRGDTHIGKLSRAIRMMKEPPVPLSHEGMMNQLAKDIIATEKLRELDLLSREAAKPGFERRAVRHEHSQGF